MSSPGSSRLTAFRESDRESDLMKWSCLTLKMEALRCSETSIICYRASQHVSESLKFPDSCDEISQPVFVLLEDRQYRLIYGGRFFETSEACSDNACCYNLTTLALRTSEVFSVLRGVEMHFASSW